MTALIIQNDFTHGEFDPRLLARTDLQQYYKAAQQMRNVIVLPMGGAKRRPGTLYIEAITANSDEYKLGAFNYSTLTSYLFVFTDSNIAIYENDAKVADVTSPWSGSDIADIRFAQSNNLMIIVHPDFPPQQLVRGADSASWTLSVFSIKTYPAFDFKNNYSNINFTFNTNPLQNSNVQLTASSALFDASYVGGLFIAAGDASNLTSPLGYAKITGYVSSTVVNLFVVRTLDNNIIPGDAAFLGVPAWSSTYGYPSTVTFYEGRLYFGGSRSLPETVFASKVGDYGNFDIGIGLDSDAIVATLGSNSVQFINHLVSDRNLAILTVNAEYTPPQSADKPLTPSTLAIRRQSSNGSTDVEPVVLDNQVFYVKRGGLGIMTYYFDFNVQSYQSYNASIFSSHLINDPVDAGALKGTALNNADFMFVVNGDGTMATYQTLQAQNVSAWTLCETDGKFKRVEQVGDYVYTIVERTIENQTVQYLEKLDFNTYTDCAYQNTYEAPTSIIIGLDHLEGEIVRVRGDGFVLRSQTVVSGQLQLERAVTEVEVGLNFQPQILLQPVNINTQEGSVLYKPKRVSRVYVQVYESLGVYVNGRLIPFLEFGNDVLDQAPMPKTGVYEINNIAGWDPLQAIEITQNDPLDMLILAIGQEVSA